MFKVDLESQVFLMSFTFGGVFSLSSLLASASVDALSDGLMRNTRTTLAPAVTSSGSSGLVNLMERDLHVDQVVLSM